MSSRPQWLREAPGGPAANPFAQQPAGHEALRSEHQPVIVCAACRAHVTAPSDGIEVNGAHSHAFVNPTGVIYRIRCFRVAPGAAGLGERSDHWTWFPGFHWQACICRCCFEHLGWRFQSATSTFFGLITERVLELRERPEPAAKD
jgi:hypothetical protein